MWQHVATLQLFRCAEKDKVFSRQRPCFRQRCFMQVCQLAQESLPTETSGGRHQCLSVVAQATPRIWPRPAHDRTAEASARVNERKRRLSMLSSMCQHVATSQIVSYVKKDKAFSRQCTGFRQSCFMPAYVDISVCG